MVVRKLPQETMNNGLNGRYLDSLESWNDARGFASNVIKAVFNSDTSFSEVFDDWDFSEVEMPSKQELKEMVNEVLFLDSRNSIDKIARAAMKWDGWENVESPHSVETMSTNTSSRGTVVA